MEKNLVKRKVSCTMLVDDDTISNYISEKYIRNLNITDELKVASNGQMALKYIEECPLTNTPYPELIFLDINMPIMDAFDFLSFYRSIYDQHERGVIIILTTSNHPKDIDKLKQFGISDYINKPLTSEKLMQVMKTHFNW